MKIFKHPKLWRIATQDKYGKSYKMNDSYYYEEDLLALWFEEITLNQFKELISWMTADEMEDLMLDEINWYYLYENYRNWWSLSYVMLVQDREKSLIKITTKYRMKTYQKMLLRLLTNNYLSDYQLITLHNKEENQVNKW